MIKAETQEKILHFGFFVFCINSEKYHPSGRCFAYAQHDGNQTICHPERSEGSPGKAKPADLMLSVIFNPRETTLPGVCSPVEAGEWRPCLRLPRPAKGLAKTVDTTLCGSGGRRRFRNNLWKSTTYSPRF